jgi:hypothetical protein
MKGTIARWLQDVADAGTRTALRAILGAMGDRMQCQTLTSPGLAIKAGASALVKAGSAFTAYVGDRMVRVAANTDCAALSGTVTNAYFNVYCFFLDRAGTGTSAMGVEATTLAGVKFPPIPEGKALIGFITINPTGTGNFVGGTTALDDATVVPTAVYVNVTGAFDPTIVVK